MRGGSKRPRAGLGASAARQSSFRFLPSVALLKHLPPEPVGIADMANMFGITHRTLHFYEEKGLISADRIGLMRAYSHQDVICMSVIHICRDVGIPVAVIQELMTTLRDVESQIDADAAFRNTLLTRQSEMTTELSSLRGQMQQIGTLLLPEDDDTEPVTNDNADPATLSDLELRCLALMAEGYTPMRLARALQLKIDELAILEKTIMRKFHAQNRFQAVAKAVLLGLIQA